MSSAAARLATPPIFTKTFMLGIIGSLSGYLASWENADRVRDNYLEKHRDYGDTFDFIIIGGGTAGSIAANRLSQYYSVLLLESGGEPHPFQAVPLLSNYLLNYGELDWRHVTMPQKQAFLGSVQSRASISQGRGLGGTSNLDYMQFLRGHEKDYEAWAELTGDPSWSYKNVEKYFKSLEQYAGPWNPENHGDSGELKIRPPSFTGLGEQFCQAAEANGYKQTDLNSFYSEGCDIINYPSKKGYRDSVYTSFLKGIKDRRNLAIHKYAHVNKILIRGNNDTAYAVEYDRHGKSRLAYAKKEIIVAAGAIQTAKVLMMSGIGPKADLDSVGIPVKADLPVGKNLQDHLSVYLGPFFVENGRSLNIDRDVSASSVLSLAKDGGPLTTTGFQAAAVVSSGLEKLHGGRNWPDLQLTMYGLSNHKSIEEDLNHAYGLKKDLLHSYLDHSKGLDSFSIVISGGRPKSTGTVKLLNRNPYAPLIINPNYFDKIYDVVVMVDGIKKALRFVENSTVFHDDLNARFTRQILPGCEAYRFRSDAYFECFVKRMSVSMGNVAGTAPMGTVLNSKLQVKGIKRLRVMDASVMPSIVTTSTAATVMMIAEKGADMLIKQYEGSGSQAIRLKDTNLVVDKVKSGGLDGSKILLDTLKLTAAAASKAKPSFTHLNLSDLHKLTKSVGSLASMLDPKLLSESVRQNSYTGSFDLGSAAIGQGNSTGSSTMHPLAAFATTLGPHLKSQLGGLYQNLFEDGGKGAKSPGKVNQSVASGSSVLSNTFKLLTGPLASVLDPSSDADPLKLIQTMMDNMKELENITAMASGLVGNSLKPKDKAKNNMTLEEIFGIAQGAEDEWEEYEKEYEIEEGLNVNSTTPTTSSTSSPTTAKTTTTRKPRIITWATSTTPQTTTTTITTPKPKSTPSTSKKPFIDYSYEVLPVPLTSSKDISQLASQQSVIVNSVSAKPVYLNSKPTQQGNNNNVPVRNAQAYPSPPIPVENTNTYKVSPAPGQVQPSVPQFQKIKNLEALAQIQHQTLTKLKHKQQQQQQQRPQIIPSLNRPFPPQSFRNPPPQMLAHQAMGQQFPPFQQQQPQGPPDEPSLSILPPPQTGRFPPPQYFQNPQGGPPPLHPVYDQMLKPVQPYPPTRSPRPGSIFHRPQPTVDPANLKYAVSSIMNAKYAPPSANPFQGMLDFLSKNQETTTQSAGGVLKSLQLRANVEKFLNLPFSLSQAQPSPISITHSPTYPPPTTIPPTRPPPPPLGPEELAMLKFRQHQEQLQQDDGVFAPIKDVLQPLTNLIKGPLSLLPNPFKSSDSGSSSSSSLLPSFLSSDMFQHRHGLLNSESTETYTFPSPSSHNPPNKTPLSSILPGFFMNHSKLAGDIPPEIFLLALANLTTGLPKPFVLQPSKSLIDSSSQSQQNPSVFLSSQQENKGNKKQLDESISDILSQLKNHHFASMASDNTAEENSGATGSTTGINSANEILNLDYKRVPTIVKASLTAAAKPNVKQNPPMEFHKSPWAKEPPLPSKSLHFKIKIV